MDADLVVDASGRRSGLPRWLTDIGAAPIVEEQDDSGFVYYGRHFRSADGQMPAMFSPLKQDLGTIGILTLPADNGTWSVTLTASSSDAALRALRKPETWEKVNRMLPLTAHWIDAEPLDETVVMMAKLEDRIRDFAPGGNPVATGVVAVADSWSCTNPSLGRGASIGLLHAVALRDLLGQAGDPWAVATGWAQATSEVVEPWYRATRAYDRHRLHEIQALIDGHPYETDDEFWLLNHGLEAAALQDADNIRAVLDMGMALRRPDEVLGDGALQERILGQEVLGPVESGMAPNREQLLAAVSG
jgi:2-polyprenyl-6-methoxyphenol hydroxylase-like FAD-dependent oxidoreductase